MNRPGHCCLCETPIREIISRHTSGKKKGEPRELGPWNENAWKVTYILSDGSLADITFCDQHLDGDYGNIWASVKERFLWEEDNLDVERTETQQHKVEKELNRVLGLKIVKEVGRRMCKYG